MADDVDQAYDQHLNMILGDVEETVTTIEIDEETYEEIYKVRPLGSVPLGPCRLRVALEQATVRTQGLQGHERRRSAGAEELKLKCERGPRDESASSVYHLGDGQTVWVPSRCVRPWNGRLEESRVANHGPSPSDTIHESAKPECKDGEKANRSHDTVLMLHL
ncbi:U6 snRNA-associated Sm-like protein LSm3 isoform X2 [Symphalangus syndactylus]|uniref:U6 snRNA-associated Sm-like protein LSm3 isoform X2 n=1 Tax=Symphalangus syndactylus TaxID=9590 RepID=UPI003007686F